MANASMLNAKRIFFIVLSNVGVRLFRLGIYSTSNSQRASAARGFEHAHAQKHPSTNGHAATLIKRERTTDLKLANFPPALAATIAALRSTSRIPSAVHGYHGLGSGRRGDLYLLSRKSLSSLPAFSPRRVCDLSAAGQTRRGEFSLLGS